ncbi:hypothetical protein QEH59_15315 [Coraliomargarita sp. SDUM461004]|uniref:DUF4230 domain-containing protein n=1 Tax=Thalassobacterium sedimentorum TaxID=3041258 RepID=A0ABU1APX2_9BACT|nr:hypothetical protein [Coraliomargarita sp. SDUM461004]MDQ8195801.1 hypothetical protein [Coraliomargarita sp. SDUM461004]
MKNFLFTIIFLGLTVFLGYELYLRIDRGEPAESGGKLIVSAKQQGLLEQQGLEYPDEIEIVRKDGSRLDVLLVARDATHIQFKRLSDQLAFIFKIEDLDRTSRATVLSYPNSGLLQPVELEEVGKVSTEDLYLTELGVAIARINSRIDELDTQYQRSESQVKQRTLRNRINVLIAERTELESKVAERKK